MKGFEFLGIEIRPGLIRPSAKAQRKLLNSIEKEFRNTCKAFADARSGKPLERTHSLISTLKRIDGMIDGWGKHYWFCNDGHLLVNLDTRISDLIRRFLGVYASARERAEEAQHRSLLGITELSKLERRPFNYPKSVRTSNLEHPPLSHEVEAAV